MLADHHIPTPWINSLSNLGEDLQLNSPPSVPTGSDNDQVLSDNAQDIVGELVSIEMVTDRSDKLLSKVKYLLRSPVYKIM